MPFIRLCLIAMLLTMAQKYSLAQVRVSGIVYDISQSRPLEAVSVLTTSGTGTATDSLGQFSVVAKETDSIWFSYLNKPTPKYPISSIRNLERFEISLHVNTTELKEVRFMPRNYRMDSLQNRQDYAKAFNFQKPGIGSVIGIGPTGGAGLDINELIGMFQFRKNRRMLAFQERLLKEEEEKYIDYRFNRALIIRLTQLRGAALDSFMVRYRPTIEFTQSSSDYEFQTYIKQSFKHYQKYRRMLNELRGSDE